MDIKLIKQQKSFFSEKFVLQTRFWPILVTTFSSSGGNLKRGAMHLKSDRYGSVVEKILSIKLVALLS